MSEIANTPEPPYYAVIFSSHRTEDDNGYADMARSMVQCGHDLVTDSKKGLQHRCKPLNSWCARQDSNLRPSASEADTLSS